MAPNITFFGAGHLTTEELPDVAANIRVGRGAYIGGNSTIRYGVTIGAGAVVAAGSVVTKAVPENTVVGGVPARTIKPRYNKTRTS